MMLFKRETLQGTVMDALFHPKKVINGPVGVLSD